MPAIFAHRERPGEDGHQSTVTTDRHDAGVDAIEGGYETEACGADLTWLLEARSLLRQFGRELSRPVTPNEKDAEYRPSQHICYVAREGWFDGVAFPSAMGPGYNVVLFNPTAATPTSVVYRQVLRPMFRFEAYRYPQLRWDEDR